MILARWRFDLRDELHQQVQTTLAEGATLLLGGEKNQREGNYYAPTVLEPCHPRNDPPSVRSCLVRLRRLRWRRMRNMPAACQRLATLVSLLTVFTADADAGRSTRPRAGVRRGASSMALALVTCTRGLWVREEKWFWSRAFPLCCVEFLTCRRCGRTECNCHSYRGPG